MCKAYQNSNALDVDSDSDASVGDSDSGSSAFKLNVKLIVESTNRLPDKLAGYRGVYSGVY